MKFLRKLSRKTKVIVSATLAAALIATPVLVRAGFGPDRPTYDWNKYVAGVTCTDPVNALGRCGAMDGPVFNSFVNTPTYGDERNFMRIAQVVPGQKPNDADYRETQTAEAGKEYWVRALVHNDSNQNLNCLPEHRDPVKNDCTQIDPGSPGIATGVHVQFAVASGQANGVDVMATVLADNSTPKTVWDTATLNNDKQAFSVEYEKDSAVLFNGVHPTGLTLSGDPTASGGVPIGYSAMDGVVPGCFDFSAYVYAKVMVKAPALQMTKLVRKQGDSNWQDSITAKLGDTLEWKIEFKNTGNDTDKNVTVRDTLPDGVTLVHNSINVTDANRTNQQLPDTALGSGGANFGNYAPVSGDQINGKVQLATTINKDFKSCELTNTTFGRAENVPETSDTAKVKIENCNQTPPPAQPAAKTTTTTLPNTGPGDVLEIAGGTMAGSTALYQLVLRRKFRK